MQARDVHRRLSLSRSPEPEPAQPLDRAKWPCRFCQQRDTIVITLRQEGTLVCFCVACEQGWCTDEQGKPRD